MLSDGVRGKDRRRSEIELPEIAVDDVEVADDERGEARGIEMPLRGARHLVGGDALHPRNEPSEVIVREIVQRKLRHRTGNLVGGLEIPREPARERRNSQRELVGRDGPGSANGADLTN